MREDEDEMIINDVCNMKQYRSIRGEFNWGRIKDEFNPHRIESEFEELMIYMIQLDDDIDMN